MGNVLWLSTGELASNVNTDKTFNFVITPRKISGTVYWAGTSEKAYDVDTVGREVLGSSTTSSSGAFTILYSASHKWDDCCSDTSRRPDPQLEVWVGGQLWATTAEVSNVNSDLSYSIGLTRIAVTGIAYWQETCKPALGATVVVKDDDTFSSQTMATGVVSSTGSYSVNVNYKEEGSSYWDTCCSDSRAPDIFSEFVYGGSSKGKTSIAKDVWASAGTSKTISQGFQWIWRGDAAPAAQATQDKLGLDTDWIRIEEYNGCSPRRVRVSIVVNFQKEGDTTSTQFDKLKQLFKKGIAENWSRTGSRAVTLSNGLKYDVITQVVEDPDGQNVELEWVESKDYERSWNGGSIAIFSFDPIIYYNKGFFKENWNDARGWEYWADYNFLETAAHEFGHSILRASPPANPPSCVLTDSQCWSFTHKGTSTIWQNPLPSTPNYPATGDADLMFYWNGKRPNDFYNRTFAAEDDVRRMVGIAGTKHSRYSTCACP
ncbi:hypothetical protein ABPG77_009909 [Micractinium sp. CCAP 211/92]